MWSRSSREYSDSLRLISVGGIHTTDWSGAFMSHGVAQHTLLWSRSGDSVYPFPIYRVTITGVNGGVETSVFVGVA